MKIESYPLTDEQRYMYDEQIRGFGMALTLSGSAVFKGSQSIEKLEKAANEVIRINEGIRVRVTTDEQGEPVQFVAPYEERSFKVKEFGSKEELDRFGSEEWALMPLDFGPDNELFDMQIVMLPDSYGALIRTHHIISDAWTLFLVCSQFIKILNGETVKAYPYRDFIENAIKYKQSSRFKKDLEFFAEQEKTLPVSTHLSTEPIFSLEKHCRAYELSKEEVALVRDYALTHKVAEANIFSTAVCIWMSKMLGMEDFYVGITALNRAGIREKNTVGAFALGVANRICIKTEESFEAGINAVSLSRLSGYRHQKAGMSYYVNGKEPYDIWISYQTASFDGDIEATFEQYQQPVMGPVMLLKIIDGGDDRIIMQLEYNVKYPDRKAERLVKESAAILMEGIRDDKQKVKEITDKVMEE